MQKEESSSDLAQQAEEAEIKGRFKVKHIKSAEESVSGTSAVISDVAESGAVSVHPPSSSAAPAMDGVNASNQQKKSRFTVKTIVNKEEEVSVETLSTPKPPLIAPSLPPAVPAASESQRLEERFEHLMSSHQRLTSMMQEILSNQVTLMQQQQPPRAMTASASNSSLTAADIDTTSSSEKDKSLAKMSHYLNEMRRELEAAAKQRKEQTLEMKRLREKCQQLEDKLAVETTRCSALEDRAEKSKARALTLQNQLDIILSSQQQQQSSVNSGEVHSNDQIISLAPSAVTRGVAPQSNDNSNQTLSSSVADEADLRLLSST